MRGKTRLLSCSVILLALCVTASSASAYTTRIHMVLANKIRQKLIESGNNTVQLEKSGDHIVFSVEDAEAIINHPTIFRAGAIGPDNFVFPALADASHALGLYPFDQCEHLYQAVVNSEERAFALGCFLHGTTDAMAHHLVNYMSGETFTLNPLVASRASSWENVAGHILAEGLIQSAAVELDPGAFAADKLLFNTPRGFVQREYYQESSMVWQLASTHAREKLDAAAIANPGAALFDVVLDAGLGPYEYIILMPIYLREVDPLLEEAHAFILAGIADMQDPNSVDGGTLQVAPGPDQVLGTRDDTTICTATCAQLYATYFVYTGLVEPRQDGNGNPLPSAFDKIAEKLRADIFAFQEAYLTTVDNVAGILAAPILPGEEGFITAAEVTAAIQPLRDWQNNLTTIDYTTLTMAVLPAWLAELQAFFNSVGITLNLTAILQAILQPVVDEINMLIQSFVIDQARVYFEEFVTAYEQLKAPILADYAAKLAAATNPDLGSNMMDNLFDSGVWVNSFNLATTAMANRALVLPEDDRWMGFGPASFDASHTAEWMQAAVCDYIRPSVFPLGYDLVASMTVQVGATVFPAQISINSPVECHDGSITEFAASANATNCNLVGLEELVNNPVGSMTRSFPPSAVDETVACMNIPVDGLPDPPAGGCSCETTGRKGNGGLMWALIMFFPAMLLMRRRRRSTGKGLIALFVALLFTGGCGGDSMGMPDADITNPRGALIAALGSSTWSSLQMRGGIERAYELQFRADSLLWAEVQNPYGPARKREMRQMQIAMDATVDTTVIVPQGWPIPQNNGETGTWTLTVTDGTPRMLTVVKMGGDTETFTEGAWPAPTGGLTAVVRAFSQGATREAFCNPPSSGCLTPPFACTDWDYGTVFNAARGNTADPLLGMDIVAGVDEVALSGPNAFSIRDIPGFDRLGGTERSETSNYIVHYFGTVSHNGSTLWARERDDCAEATWMMTGSNVGTTSGVNAFLEIFDFTGDDDEVVSGNFTEADLPAELIVTHCAPYLFPDTCFYTSGVYNVHPEVSWDGSTWELMNALNTKPEINNTLFPPVF